MLWHMMQTQNGNTIWTACIVEQYDGINMHHPANMSSQQSIVATITADTVVKWTWPLHCSQLALLTCMKCTVARGRDIDC